MAGGQKRIFLPKFGKKSDFVHISALFLQSTRLSQQWALQEGYMTCSLTFCSSKTAQNGPKWPKRPKMAKNGQKTVKNSIFFRDFFLLIFFLLCRHFICCSLKQVKMPQNGQKQPKTAFLTVFGVVKNLHPRCK